jgi:S1-C subfamily serine protease
MVGPANENAVIEVDDLYELLDEAGPGALRLTIVRGAEERQLTIQLGAM